MQEVASRKPQRAANPNNKCTLDYVNTKRRRSRSKFARRLDCTLPVALYEVFVFIRWLMFCSLT